MQSVVIAGVGAWTPAKVLKNEEFPAMGIDTSDEWIRTRTGIHERRIAVDGETIVTMAAEASRRALMSAGATTDEVELIILATVSPLDLMPSNACNLQRELGVANAPAFDLSAACSGFPYAITTAEALMRARGYKTALVVASEKNSSIVDWNDRNTCVLFGDGAGAVILKLSDEPKTGIVDSILGADGKAGQMLTLPIGGKIKMSGKEVFKLAVTAMADTTLEILTRNGLTKEDVTLVIPHQANSRIIEAVAERMKLPMDKFLMNLDKYGNTSAASIPLALNQAVEERRLKKGDWMVLVSFGGGLTWGTTLIKWA